MTLDRRFFLTVFLPFALGYYLSFFFRIVNGVIAEPMALELGIGPASLGWIGSAYFLFFAAAQLPLGVLLDRYDTRNVASLILLIAVAGALLFAFAQTPAMLWLGRGLIGLGVSACLMAAFRAYVALLPADRLPLVNGLQLACGGLGAITATAPVELLLPLIGWRGLFVGLAAVTLLIALLVRLRVPRIIQHDGPKAALGEQIRGSLSVFASPIFLRVAPASVLNQAIFIAMLGLWAAVWLREVEQLTPSNTADMLFWAATGMALGYMTLGGLSSWLLKYRIATTQVAMFCMTMFFVAMLLLIFRVPVADLPLWFLLGYFGSSGSLMYAALTRQFPVELAGRVNTALNLLLFVCAFLLQWLMGVVVSQWEPSATGQYPVVAYQASFAVCAVAQGLALLWFKFWRHNSV